MDKFYTHVMTFGNSIFERGVDENGLHFLNKIPYKPTFYIPSKEKTKYKSLDGRYLDEIKPGDMKESRDFLNRYKGVEGFEIFGITLFPYAYISDTYSHDIDYDYDKINIVNFDIEVASDKGFPQPEYANDPIITIALTHKNKFYVWGMNNFNIPEQYKGNLTYFECADESHLLQEFILTWMKINPDIMTGWNIMFFDIPYLVNRINKVLGETWSRKLSPWGFISEKKVQASFGSEKQTYDIGGITNYDYFELYKKFTYSNQESYRLDHIGSVELGMKKLDYSEYESLHQLYKHDYQKFVEYNIRDVEIVDKLEDKMKLIEMVVALAYDAKVNFNDVFTQVRMWDILIYNHLRKRDIIIPPKKDHTKSTSFEGAFVKNPIIGMHEWIASFDLNSLYPHLIMQYNISPETLIDSLEISPKSIKVDELLNGEIDLDYCKDKDICIAANGQHFTRKFQGFLPEMMEKMYIERSLFKKKMLEAEQNMIDEKDPDKKYEYSKLVSKYKNMQMARKIQLNSAYGAIGNQFFRFFDIRLAEAITYSGQLSIRWVERDVNKFFNKTLGTKNKDYVIASDTDSIYVNFGPLIEKIFPNGNDTNTVIKFMDKACEEKIQEIIDNSYMNLKNYMNAYAQKMFMKREVLADKGIWTAKKHYILNVHNSEGVQYDKPKLKIMGIEAVKSSTPMPCREKLKDAFKIMMNSNESDMHKFIKNFREEFKTLEPEDVAFPRSVKGIDKYNDPITVYKKSTPIHVRGAILHNKELKEKKLTDKYALIQEGEKIKFTYLKLPNPLQEDVVAMGTILPKELGLHKYVDYDKQFNKSFIDPLRGVLDAINWTTEEVATLNKFFM